MATRPKIVVPPGKEQEYRQGPTGEVEHVTYGSDPSLPGTVIPSGREAKRGGDSAGFSADDMDIPQQVIEFGAEGVHVVRQVTRRELTYGEATAAQDQEQPMAKSAKRSLPRVAKSKLLSAAAQPAMPAVPARPAYAPARQPVLVGIEGPFGKLTLPYSEIFMDGICVVLVTRHAEIPGSYQLPPISEEPLQLRVTYGEHVMNCFWGGIQFLLPDKSATFTVLLLSGDAGTV